MSYAMLKKLSISDKLVNIRYMPNLKVRLSKLVSFSFRCIYIYIYILNTTEGLPRLY